MARRIEVEILGNTRGLERAFGRVQHESGRLERGLRGLGRASLYAGTALTGGAVFGLEKSVHAALDAESSQARLGQAFRAAGLSMKPYRAEIDKTESASRKL